MRIAPTRHDEVGLKQTVAGLIVTCQQMHISTAVQAAALDLAPLKFSTLNGNVQLDITTPVRKLALGGAADVGGGERKASIVPRSHEDLTHVGRDACVHLAPLVQRRWFDKRYNSTVSEDMDFYF